MKLCAVLLMAFFVEGASNWPPQPRHEEEKYKHRHASPHRGEQRHEGDQRRINAIGLRSHGATCFFNALMQGLFSLRHFRHLILRVDLSRVPFKAPAELVLLRRLQRLFRAMETGVFDEVDLPRLIGSVLDYEGRPLFKGRQEDVHVYLGHLITMLEHAFQQLPNKHFEALTEAILGSRTHYSEGGDIIDVEGRGLYNLNPITLELGKGGFQKALTTSFIARAPDLRRGDREVNGVVNTQVACIPQHLIIQLRRMRLNGEVNGAKLNDPFEFPRTFALGDSVGLEGNADRYTLRAIVIHIGKATSGHYTAIVRRDGNWLLFDDDRVRPIPESEVSWRAFGGEGRDENAYILFYDRDVPAEVRH